MMYEQIQQQQQMMSRVDRRKVMGERRKAIEEEEVDLSGMSLETIPNPSLNLAAICKLNLSNNDLQMIPESLTARMLNLVVLDVHSNQLRSLPNSIGCLSKLKALNVSCNLLVSLPRTIENCRSLEELNVNFNKLSRLPDTMGFELVTSRSSRLREPYQSRGPKCKPKLQYLETLPYSIGLLLSLVELDVSYNKITTLPDSMGCLRKLQKLSVEGNPLISPPMEVVERGVPFVKEYLSEKMNAGHKSPTKKKVMGCGKSPKHTWNRSIEGLASPRYLRMFSPARLFSSKNLS
ncbi:hypothetical protein POTOM_060271 [Populus tomentosa]|uniref:Leucine-rich repeat family protein n=1 Tax=Populus tomentosa TaxID=118781 RepID=A0A8X7XR38_POPTO|nr:hypothetical protein POTOM_060271 [Populus tomentosa]